METLRHGGPAIPDSSRQREPFSVVADAHLLLLRGQAILLGRRTNTGFADGCYHPPAGHLEPGESIVAAVIREADEEIGILIDERDVKLAHVMHNASDGGRVAFFFAVRRWHGEIVNREPDKCSDLRWFPTDELPDRMSGCARAAIGHYLQDRPFSLHGW
jgi:8-oxo-dGTP diphosphatase